MRSLVLIVCLALTALAGEPPGSYYVNETWGFKLKVPKGWREAAVSSDTRWLCSKHLGKRELEGRLEDRDWMSMEAPEMWVVGFPRAKGEVTNPYENYRDYITRDTTFINFGDKYRFVEEKDTTVGGLKVSTYHLRKGEKKKIGRRVVAWVFHFDDMDIAVQFKVLEWHYSDYEASFRGCLKSFKRVERKKALEGGGAVGTTEIKSRDHLEWLPPEKRSRAFKDAVEATLASAVDGLPADWRHQRTKGFVVLTNADKKFVRAAIQHTNAVNAHLDKLFGKPTADYVPPFVLRIFATDEEWRAYGTRDEATDDLVREIATYSGKGYVRDNSLEHLNQLLWSRALQERHAQLEGTLPSWLKEGFKKYMRMVRTKGRKIAFAHGDWDRDEIRLQIKKGNYEPLRTIMGREIHDPVDGSRNMEGRERERQTRMVVLWLMKQGNKGKRKDLIPNFVINVATAIDAFDADWVGKNPRPVRTKDGEGDIGGWLQARHGHIAEKRTAILQDAWKRSFGSWKDSDWKRLTTNWLSFAK